MKKLVMVTLVVAGLIAMPMAVFAGHGDTSTGRAQMHPENQSGVIGRLDFKEDPGVGVLVTGTARGMDPSKTYVSLVYDIASVPGGPEGCEPRRELIPEMLVGTWEVDPSGNGMLNGSNPNELGTFKTVSIRDAQGGPAGDGRGPEAVVACGVVAVHPAGK